MPISTEISGTKGRRRPSRAFSTGRGDIAEELQLLKSLWARQRAVVAERGPRGAQMAYLESHFAMDLTLRRHLDVIDAICPHIRGRVLEWGCQHALDSCIYRRRFGDQVELHGCDFNEPDDYPPFHGFSRLRYSQLTHPYHLDYDDASFDVVTSNGVLEHVPHDVNSLEEIHRVLKPGGNLVIACLPNRYSYTEAFQRHFGNTAHDRLYSIAGTKQMLMTVGFQVLAVRYVFLLPTMLNGFPQGLKRAYQKGHRVVWSANRVLERLWPLNRLASNLMLVARKERNESAPA